MAGGEKFDPYAVLGVSKDATQDQIKSAYMRLAAKFHPDRCPSNSESDRLEYEEKFKQIQAANAILGNEEKRKQFDRYGTTDPRMSGASMEDIMNTMFGGMMGGSGGQKFSFSFGGDSPFDMGGGDPFQQFGGSKSSSYSRQPKQRSEPKPKCPLLREEIEISIFECFKGISKNVYYKRKDASGSMVNDSVSVTIPAGMKAGSRFTYPNKGNSQKNYETGDLVITLKITDHPSYQIDDIDIKHTKHVSLQEALEVRQRKYVVNSVDGVRKELLIPENEIINSNTTKIFPGLGMPNRKSKPGEKPRGDMIVQFIVDVPENLSDEQRQSIIKFMM